MTLNRRDKRMALSFALMEQLRARLRRAASPRVRAIVIEANGPAFSAGRDLSEMLDRVRSSSACSTSARS